MGSRATDKLKEIDQVRAGLAQKLDEIERRVPLAGFGRKAAAMVAGTSAGGTAVAFVLRRLRRGGKRGRRKEQVSAAPPSVTVNVFPKGAAWIAAAGLAAWAASRAYEAFTQAKASRGEELFRPAVVKPMPEPGRQSGAGN